MEINSFFDILLNWSHSDKANKIAYTFLVDGENKEENCTYMQLDSEARRIASVLQEYCKPHDRVILAFNDSLDFVKSFFACIYANLIAVPSLPPKKNRYADRIELIANDADAKVILSSFKLINTKTLSELKEKKYRVLFSDEDIGNVNDFKVVKKIEKEDIAFLQYTSGSTGKPKGVMVSHGNLLHNQEVIKKVFRHSENADLFGWLPLYHDMGLVGNALQPIYLGGRCILTSPYLFFKNPSIWLKGISKYKVNTSGGPNFAYDLCVDKINHSDIEGINLSNWKVAYNGAEPISADTLKRFYNKFQDYGFCEKSFLPCYGMAETTLLISGRHGQLGIKTKQQNLKDAQISKDINKTLVKDKTSTFVSCGKPEYVDTIIVDIKGNVCEQGQVGEIWVNSPSNTLGYWNNIKETGKYYNQKLKEKSYFRTGDLGMISNGELYITGRLKEIIIINGVNYYPDDLEKTAVGCNSQIIPNSTVAVSNMVDGKERLYIISEVIKNNNLDVDKVVLDIKTCIFQEYDLNVYQVYLIRRGSLLKTTSGKPQRKASLIAIEQGELPTIKCDAGQISNKSLSGETLSSIEQKVYSIVKSISKVPTFSKSQHFAALGFDSIKLVELSSKISKEFNIEIPYNEIYNYSSLEDLSGLISEKSNTKPISFPFSEKREYYKLTCLQKSMWLYQQKNIKSTAYNIPLLLPFKEKFEPDKLKKIVVDALNRYDALWTNIIDIREEPVQVFRKSPEFFDVPIFEYDNLLEKELKKELHHKILSLSQKPFDLANDFLIRSAIICNSDRCFVIFVVHHIIIDGFSIRSIINTIEDNYYFRKDAINPHNNSLKSFKDFVQWEHYYLKSVQSKRQSDYWKKELSDYTESMDLPYDRTCLLNEERIGASKFFKIEGKLFEDILQLNQDNDRTSYTLLLSALFILLHRLTGSRDLIVGTPSIVRNTNDFSKIIGLLINVIHVRVKLDTSTSFQSLFGIVNDKVKEGLKNSSYPLYDLFETRYAKKNANSSLTNVNFNYLGDVEHADNDFFDKVYQHNLDLNFIFDFNLYVLCYKDHFKIRFDYCKSLFYESSIEFIIAQYISILKEICLNPNISVDEINYIPRKGSNSITPNKEFKYFEKQELESTVLERFKNQAEQYPDKVAVRDYNSNYTYKLLYHRINRVSWLLHNCSPQIGEVVGLVFGHEFDMIVGIFAVLNVGKIYLPIDNEYPSERIRFILNDTEAKIILTNSKYFDIALQFKRQINKNIEIINIDEKKNDLSVFYASKRLVDDLAYILYTSGSTGNPKGVLHSQQYVMQITRNFTNSLHINFDDIISLIPSFYFSASVMDTFGALLNGATLVFIDVKNRGVVNLFHQIMQEQITIYHSVPTLFRCFVQQIPGPTINRSLRLVYVAGEPFLKTDIEEFRNRIIGDCIIVNGLGCTEYNILRQFFIDKSSVLDTSNIPVGFPVPDTEILISDLQTNRITENNQEGEILIKSAYLTKGYLNNQELTCEKLQLDKNSQKNIFRTGDIGKKLIDGRLIHLGRKDFQIKLNGQRIEPGEIEASLKRHDLIKDAVVVLKRLKSGNSLCAYYVSDHELNPGDLRRFVLIHLPVYMVPDYYLWMKSFPRTSTGKVSRNQLPDPVLEKASGTATYSKKEKELEKVWKHTLSEDIDISRKSNYFQIGGNSIKLIQLLSKINKTFNLDLKISELFQNPGFGDQIELINNKAQIVKFRPVKQTEKKEYYALTTAQQSLWVLSQGEQNKAFNLIGAYIINGEIDIKNIDGALKHLVFKNEILRTRFVEINGMPQMEVLPAGCFSSVLHVENAIIPDFDIKEYVKNELSEYKFDLSKPPLFLFKAFQISKKKWILAYVFHHIICDGWSEAIIFKELKSSLVKVSDNTAIDSVYRCQYKDYANWRNSKLKNGRNTESKHYWREKLNGFVDVPVLPSNDVTNLENNHLAQTISFFYSKEKIYNIKNKEQINVFSVLVMIVKTLIFRLTGKNDIIIGTDISGRNHSDIENQIGYFLNFVPLRTIINPLDKSSDVMRKIQDTIEGALEHQDYPIEEILKDNQQDQLNDLHDLFNVLVLFQNFDKADLNILNADIAPLNIRPKYTYTDLLFEFIELPERIELNLRYNSGVFSKKNISLFAKCFNEILNSIHDNINQIVTEIAIISEPEKNRILNIFNSPFTINEEYNNIFNLFTESVSEFSDKIALNFGNHNISYGTLYSEVIILSQILKRKYCINPTDSVAIICGPGIESIKAIFAVLYVGGVYIPIDTKNPKERIDYIIKDSKVKLVITNYSGKYEVEQLIIERNSKIKGKVEGKQEGRISLPPYQLAYILYTSGTTGYPKGVKITHRSLSSYVKNFISYFGLKTDDKVLQQSSLAFDVSVEEVFPILTLGGTLIVSEGGGANIQVLLENILKKGITLVSTTPLIINEINLQYKIAERLKILISGGDILQPYHINNLFGQCRIFNTYGPTETTVCATYFEIKELSKKIPIGKPVKNKQVYVCDEFLNILPVGVPGELLIAGEGNSVGYLNNSKLTKDKFVKNPFSHGTLFKTGDLGKWLDDGNIEFIGRVDDQEKIGGYRVEIKEIEYWLSKYPSIQDCAVIVNKVYQERQLVAFVVMNQEYNKLKIKKWLSGKLPGYMIPHIFINLDNLPVNANGKRDVKYLKNYNFDTVKESYVSARNTMEANLLAVWRGVFDSQTIGIENSFFELGGNSITAIKLVNRINKLLDSGYTANIIFKYPTIIELAEKLNNSNSKGSILTKRFPVKNGYNLSSQQSRLWLLCQFTKAKVSYNIPLVLKINGDIKTGLFKKSIDFVVQKHESLRTVFRITGEVPQQYVLPFNEIKDRYFEVVSSNDQYEIENCILQTLSLSFNLESGPLFRICLIQINSKEYRLVVNIHHLICDAWSVNIFLKELFLKYKGLLQGQNNALNEKVLQYWEFSEWQNEETKSEQFTIDKKHWLNRFKGEIPLLSLPIDKKRSVQRTFNGDTITIPLEKSLYADLNGLAKRTGTSLFMLLATSVKVLLYKLTQQTTLIIGTPVSGRRNEDLEDVIGFFANTLPLKSELDPESSFLNFLYKIKNGLLNALEHDLYFYDQLITDLKIERNIGRNPLFDIFIVLNNLVDFNHLAIGGNLEIVNQYIHPNKSKFDLSFLFDENKNGLLFRMEYNSDIFNQKTVEKLGKQLSLILKTIVHDVNIPVKNISIVSSIEKDLLLNDFCDNHYSIPADKTVLDLFYEQVGNWPNSIACISDNQFITYKYLDNITDTLSSHIQSKGAKPGEIVSVLVRRNQNILISIFAILKARCAFLTIDAKLPKERIGYMIKKSGSKFMITDIHDTETRHFFKGTPINIAEQDYFKEETFERFDNGQCQLAYIMFTSGSTGQPKAVMIPHIALYNFVKGITDSITFKPQSTFLCLTSVSFDIFILETILPLCYGHKVVIGNESDQAISENLNRKVSRHQIEVIQVTPSKLRYYLSELDSVSSLKNIQKFLVGGEPFDMELLKKYRLHFKAGVYNMYGPTETTIWSTFKRFENEKSITVGKPILNTSVFILDNYKELQPIGIFGNVYIGGKGLALGYLEDEELTSQRFINNPFNRNEILYDTGDVGRWLENGEIEIAGRKDRQVKLRGYRIEMGEIEYTLNSLTIIDDSAVIIEEKNGNKFLKAFIVSDKPVNIIKLKKQLLGILPEYMVPTVINQINRIPLLSSGKADYHTLSTIECKDELEVDLIPDKIQTQILDIWAQVLQIGPKELNPQMNLFQLGGNSLNAFIIITKINEQLFCRYDLSDIYTHSTISSLAEIYRDRKIKIDLKNFSRTEKKEYYCLSPSQQRFFLLHHMDKSGVGYNIPIILRTKSFIEFDAVKDLFNKLVERHEILRTYFKIINGVPKQFIAKNVNINIETIEVSDSNYNDLTRVSEKFIKPFDLSKPSLFRIAYVKCKKTSTVHLIIDIHHIITDGFSLNIITTEIDKYLANHTLSPKEYTYKDYAEWYNLIKGKDYLLKQKQFWLEKLKNGISPLSIPEKHSDNSHSIVIHNLSGETYDLVRRFISEYKISLNVLMVHILKLIYYLMYNEEKIFIFQTVTGRKLSIFNEIVGSFVNQVIISDNTVNGKSHIELLNSTRRTILNALDNQDYQISDLLSELNKKSKVDYSKIFNIGLEVNYFNTENNSIIEHTTLDYSKINSLYDIMYGVEFGKVFNIKILYRNSYYSIKDINNIINCFELSLKSVLNNPDMKIDDIISTLDRY